MSREMQTAFEYCLAAMDQGEGMDRALSRYPDLADELRPLLTLTNRTRQLNAAPPSRATVMRSRTRMLSRAHELQTAEGGSPLKPWLRWSIAIVGLSIFILVSGGLGLAVASAQSLPGDGLYPIKRSAERIQLSFTPGLSNRLSLTITQDMRRLAEVRRLLDLKRVETIEFEANLSDRQGARWQFGDIPVLVTQDTSIPSGLKVGDVLRVRGRTTSQGWVRADSIAAVGLTFDGHIEAIKGNLWVIDGRSLVILTSSRIDPNLETGDLVRVHARSEGSYLVAESILGINPAATPIPTLVPANPASDEPDPTITAEADEPDEDDHDERDDHDQEDEMEASETAEPDDDKKETEEAEHDEEASSDDGVSTPTAEESDDHSDEADDGHEGDLEKVEFEGAIQAINGDRWLIDGTTVIVDSETRLEGDPKTGDEVKVRAEQRQDGTLYALRVELRD